MFVANEENSPACTAIDPTICPFSICGKGRRLPSCAYGFAYGVTGGLHGRSYVVTNDEDDPKNPSMGSLRHGVNLGGSTTGGVWITFSQNLVIVLQDMLWLKSKTTIDGRGYNVTITGWKMPCDLFTVNIEDNSLTIVMI